MKVLLITYYWPPAGGSGVQRWLKFVKYLPEFGIEPVVYTVKDPHYAIRDESLVDQIPQGLEVIREGILEPGMILSGFGKKGKDSSAGFLNPNPSFIERQIQYVRANYFIPDAKKFWIKPSVKRLSDYLEKHEVDVLITTGPPHSLHLIGDALKKRFGISWLADFRDPWTNIDYFHSLPLTKSAIKKHHDLESMVLRNADCVLVVGKTMKEEFSDRNEKVCVLTNGFDDFEQPDQVSLDREFSISHIGLMNADRNPHVFWRALGELVDESDAFKKDLVVKLVGKCAEDVYQSIEENGLTDHVTSPGYVSHQDVLRYQQSSQVLLICVNKVPSARSVITGKVFEYLQSKRPVLGIGPTDGDLAVILKETNTGQMVDFDDVKSLKKLIRQYYEKFKSGNLTVAPQNVEQYHRKNLTEKLAKLLKEM